MTKRLVIIAGSTARTIALGGGTVRAENAYTRYQFERRRAYARKFGDAWLIFSARWGLLRPDAQVDPSYPAPERIQVSSETLARQLDEHRASEYDLIEVIAGEDYVKLLLKAVRALGVPLSAPLLGQGLGMGKQSAAIHDQIRRRKPFPVHDELTPWSRTTREQ